MKELLDRLSSYNLFNYLLPGILFVVMSKQFTRYSFIQNDIVLGVFVYYFIGMVVSRFGSLIIEPLLRRISFLKFADYKDFVTATKKDEKIELLSESNNTYRTLCALFGLLLLLKVYERVEDGFMWVKEWGWVGLIAILLIMFLFSYQKQTAYITKRIKANS